MSKILLGNLKGPQGNPGPKGDPGSAGPRGSRWVTGTAIDGISTTPTAYPTGIADSMVNDHYLNPKSGHIYRCQVAGDATTAQWVWVGNISNTDGTYKVIVDKTQPKITPEISYTFTNKVTKCVYGADVFVAISGGILYYSTYGKAWRRVTDMEMESDKFITIVYGNGKFVAFANRFSNIPYSYIYYSYDGRKWFYTDKYIKPVAQTIYSNEKFIAISNYSGVLTAYYSDDGKNWSEGSMSFDFDDSMTISENIGIKAMNCKGLACDDEQHRSIMLVEICTNDNIFHYDHNFISSDGINWVSKYMQMINVNTDICTANNFIAKDIAYVNNKFIIVGKNNSSDGSRYNIGITNYGDKFYEMIENPYSNIDFEKILSTGRYVMAFDKTTFAYSKDGHIWNNIKKYSQVSEISAVACNDYECLVFDDKGQIFRYELASKEYLRDVVYDLYDDLEELNNELTTITNELTTVKYDVAAITNSLDKHLYSITEREVGIWINGKPVYEKTLSGFAVKVGNGEWQDIINVSGLNIDTIVDATFIGTYLHEGSAQSANIDCAVRLNSGSLFVRNNNPNTAVDHITIRYTKTTDESEIIIEPET